MKTCPNCQKLCGDVISVCPKCGTPLPSAPQQPQNRPPLYQQSAPQQPQPQQPRYQQPQPQYQQPQPQYRQPQPQSQSQPQPQQAQPAKKTSSGWVTLLILIAVAVFAYIGITSGSTWTKPAETANWTSMISEHNLGPVMDAVKPGTPYVGVGRWNEYSKSFEYVAMTYNKDVVIKQVQVLAFSKSVYSSSDVSNSVAELKTEYSNSIRKGFCTVSGVESAGDYYTVTVTFTGMGDKKNVEALVKDGVTNGKDADVISLSQTLMNARIGLFIEQFVK